MSHFTCDWCRRTFVDLSEPGEPEAEASVFTAEELTDSPAVICDDCWHAKRRTDPAFDARYGAGRG